MFAENNQPSLFNFENDLNEKQRELLGNTKESWFYKLIFCNIKEHDFKPLYSEKASRPNVAVNIMVSAILLKEMKGLSFDELMESIMFDMRFKLALGLENIDKIPFARSSIFNFQNKIADYEQETGINLMETVFDNLTAKQIKELSLKTDIQRSDSTLIGSNTKRYSRLKLLIEILLRLERILSDEDKAKFFDYTNSYKKIGSEKYIYKLKSSDLPHELQKLGNVYYKLFAEISDKEIYNNTKEFNNFKRIYFDHFVVVNQEILPKPSSELNSSMLQSPDDSTATYRKKNDKESIGYTVNATETANPENPIQLLSDIVTNPNNIDDTQILTNRIDIITAKTPELKELHTDGGYGSEDNDKRFEELGITQITTAVRGRTSEIEKSIKLIDKQVNTYSVSCPYQNAISEPTKQRFKVRFDTNICRECPLKDKCQIFKDKGRFYFKHEDFLQNKRSRNILNIPLDRQKIRPNVEASMKEFKTRTNAGKTKLRGLFKTSLFAFNVGIAINFGRIFRYLTQKSNSLRKTAQNLNIFEIFVSIVKNNNSYVQIFATYRTKVKCFLNMRFSATLDLVGF